MMTSIHTTNKTSHGCLRMLAVLVAGLAASLLVAPAARPAHASTTFFVNSTGDEVDADLTDGRCDAEPPTSPLIRCTLRAALQESNATPGSDGIFFNIPGTGVHTIRSSGLPNITDPVTIDGYTQGDFTADPSDDAKPNALAKGATDAVLKVELDGTNDDAIGLLVEEGGSGSVIRGLIINRYRGEAIRLQGSSQSKIEGNFLGTDASGTSDLGNGFNGVHIMGDGVAVGNTVGGSAPEDRNLISGNDGDGVAINPFLGGSTGTNRVENNLIGTKKDGKGVLGNARSGVEILASANNVVASNTIAFNGENGVSVLPGSQSAIISGNLITSNSIFRNGGLGIDLGNDAGPTPNDEGDVDAGPNGLQNKPVITSAVTSGKRTTIKGRLATSLRVASYAIQLFSNPKGQDEGKKLLGTIGVETTSDGKATFSLKVRRVKGTVTAVATAEANQDTSEFSAPKKVVRKR